MKCILMHIGSHEHVRVRKHQEESRAFGLLNSKSLTIYARAVFGPLTPVLFHNLLEPTEEVAHRGS